MSTPPSPRRGLVLGGGGITGIAWETGLVTGLHELGIDLTAADLVVGTSAGSVVGAQLTSGTPLAELYAVQLAPPAPGTPARIGGRVMAGFAVNLLRSRGDLEGFGRRLGAWAVRRAAGGHTPSPHERFEAIRERLPVLTWPEAGQLRVTAVDVATGGLRVFAGSDGPDGVPLLDAVTASCAVPGVYPPVSTGGHTYVDGGARSGANADLAADCDRVVVLAPVDRAVGPLRSAGQQLAGTTHVVITPDEDAKRAIGRNVLDPAARPASARAGHAQAAVVAEEIRAVWDALG